MRGADGGRPSNTRESPPGVHLRESPNPVSAGTIGHA